MGEMAEYELERQEDEWLKSDLANPGETFEEWCAREAKREREESAEKAEEAILKIMRALGKGDWWVTKEGETLSLDKITPRHARNIIGWLRRRAGFLHDIACLEFMKIPEPQGEHALDDYNSSFDQLNEMDPVEWLMQTPLVINLKAKIKAAEEEG